MENIKLVKGTGLVSIQVMTESLPGRPFPAFAVLCDIKDDGTILHYAGDKEHRASVISNLTASNS